MEPAFTEQEAAWVAELRHAEIRIDHEGRLRIHWFISNEYLAKVLHDIRSALRERFDSE